MIDGLKESECTRVDGCIGPGAPHYEAVSDTIGIAMIRCPHCGEIAAELKIIRSDRIGFGQLELPQK